jgi:hypothetical protein
LPGVAERGAKLPKRAKTPVKSGEIDDPGNAASCGEKPRLDAAKGQKKGNVD